MKHELKKYVFYLMYLFLPIAKKLDLYQVLAPNAFSPVEDFVPILKKTVSSTLHEASDEEFFSWVCGVFFLSIATFF